MTWLAIFILTGFAGAQTPLGSETSPAIPPLPLAHESPPPAPSLMGGPPPWRAQPPNGPPVIWTPGEQPPAVPPCPDNPPPPARFEQPPLGLLPPPPPPALQVDRTKLRGMAHMPTCLLYIDFGNIGVAALDQKTGKRQDPAKRIAALQKEMQGDASDAERYLELGQLYEDEGRDKDASTAAFAKACALLKERTRLEPANGWLHAQYADALWPQIAVAETEALEAVRCAPADWRSWHALGNVRYNQISVALFGSQEAVPWEKAGSIRRMLVELAACNPGPESVKKAEKYLQEALQCADKAVALAPQECKVYQYRFSSQMEAVYWRRGFCALHKQPFPDLDKAFCQSSMVRDAEQMGRLRPDDPEMLGMLAGVYYLEAMSTNPKNQTHEVKGSVADGLKEAWEAMPVAARKGMESAMANLERLTNHKDPGITGPACRHLGLWLLFKGELSKAEAMAVRATALEPARSESWDLLLYCKVLRDPDRDTLEVYEVAKKQLEHCVTARNHLIVAGECVQLHRLDEAEKVLRRGLKQFPDDMHCRLGLAAVLLRKNDQPETLAEVSQCLVEVKEPILAKGDEDMRKTLFFNYAIYLALTGKSFESREMLQAIVDHDAKHQGAKKALELLAAGEH
jgi:tetratricopeptide (TPR) repeat protein